jgi:autophagy-related protein 16
MSYDGVTAVSGHLDGGVRFWDVRSGERTGEVSELHGGGVTSVNFNPNNNAEILTMGRDSTVKLVDVRQAGQELQTFQHADFKTDLSYSSCAISPDGAYAAAGSSLGTIFIWKTLDGSLERQLKGHDASIAAVAWDRGGSNGQQFASVDIKGNLLLWA